jgi:hypothetical protein
MHCVRTMYNLGCEARCIIVRFEWAVSLFCYSSRFSLYCVYSVKTGNMTSQLSDEEFRRLQVRKE